MIKSLVFEVDGELVVVLARGDHEINDIKLKNALEASSVELASEAAIQDLLGCGVGSIGPVKLPVDVKVIADNAIKSIRNGVAGANEDGFHLINVNPERDFAVNNYLDIRFIQEGRSITRWTRYHQICRRHRGWSYFQIRDYLFCKNEWYFLRRAREGTAIYYGLLWYWCFTYFSCCG